MPNILIQVRVDENLKNDASEVLTDLGLDLSSAIRLFLKQVVVTNGIPFNLKRENDNLL